jgi:hypothetical protein
MRSTTTINVTVYPVESDYTLWLEEENGKRTVTQDEFSLTTPGIYILDALINHSGNISIATTNFTIRNETNSSNNLPREEREIESFSKKCDETCVLNGTNTTLSLRWEGEEQLTITEIITIEERVNQPPQQVAALPDLTVNVGESTTLELDNYFVDPNGDPLTFDYMNAAGVDLLVEGNTLTITGIDVGISESLIYAADLVTLIQSDQFSITVIAQNEPPRVTQNESNASVLTPGNLTTTNQTNETVPENLCNNPDVNQRPVECLQEDYTQYFRPEPVRITDTGRQTIALLTPIGNLKITGEVIEQASFISRASDYRIGYIDSYGDYQATIWFDSQTGNLYLRGKLYEENVLNAPAKGSFALSNSRGVVLAWADKTAGDLYLRGAILENREELE